MKREIIEKDISYPYPGDKHERHHMVIMHSQVEEAAKQLNLNIGDLFFIVQYPDYSTKYMKYEVGEDFVDNLISSFIREGEVWGMTVGGVGEGFRRPVASQRYSNYWIEDNKVIKQSHVVPGY